MMNFQRRKLRLWYLTHDFQYETDMPNICFNDLEEFLYYLETYVFDSLTDKKYKMRLTKNIYNGKYALIAWTCIGWLECSRKNMIKFNRMVLKYLDNLQ